MPCSIRCRSACGVPRMTAPRQATDRRKEAVQRGCRYLSPGRMARRLTRRDSPGRFSVRSVPARACRRGIFGRRRLAASLRTRQTKPADSRTPAATALPCDLHAQRSAYARLFRGFPGMNRLRKRPAYAGALKLLDVG